MIIAEIRPEWEPLETWRLEHNIGIADLAARIPVDRKHLRRVMTGRARLGPRVRHSIYDFLGIDPDEWVPDRTEPRGRG